MNETAFLSVLIFAVALLYSSVGHGGASGYISAMALFGLAPEVMKPSALSLNILVATIATARFHRAGCFSWAIFWPFAVASIPLAFFGGALSLPSVIYRQIVGLVLLFAAFQLFRQQQASKDAQAVSIPQATFFGAGIGLLSGLTGVGGGIFLSPLLLLMGWAEPRQTAGVSAAFILVNSVAGLLGHVASTKFLPGAIAFWAFAAVTGGVIGSGLGSRKLSNMKIRGLLAIVVAVAGLKFMLL